jgi:VWFA-related protein
LGKEEGRWKMTIRRIAYLATLLLLFCAAGGSGWRAFTSLAAARTQQGSAQAAPPAAQSSPAQQSSQPPPQQPAEAAQANTHPITAETREVRVDVVVTDKKGNYITDLTQKDFRVYEDSKEQPINSFSFGADPNGPVQNQRHYLVLFFDTTSMDLSDQPRARAAAGKFIDAHAGPDQVMSVMNFGGSLQIVQNFTTDSDKLKKAVSGISNSNISAMASASSGTDALQYPGMSNFGNPEASFGTYTLLLSIRNLAKNLAAVPGRKSLILFTAGFELDSEAMSELTATIDACNKANVAVYPMDVRGLIAPVLGRLLHEKNSPSADASDQARRASYGSLAAERSNGGVHVSQASFQPASFHPDAAMFSTAFQHGGGGGGGHGGGGGGGMGGGGGTGGGGGGKGGTGGTGGGTGGTGGKGGTGGTGGKGGTGGTGTTGGGGTRGGGGTPYNTNAYNQARTIVPSFPASASTNQQVMYELASGTGGFPILNTNDLLPGLEKISREQNEYYLLGYAPSDSKEGSCHTLKVKVERGGTNVRARSGFCNVPSTNPLAGKPVEKDLETRAAAAVAAPAATAGATNSAAAAGAGSIEAPYFYTAANEAQVHIAMEVPSSSVNFEKVKGKYHADVNVLGIAYKPDGSVASRFSDELTLDLEKSEWEKFMKTPMHYENQFAIVPGTYRLSVALGGGAEKFGTYQTLLVVDAYDGKKLSVSSVFLSKQIQPTTDDSGVMEADLLADRTPFIVHHVQLTPSGGDHFKKSDKFALYAQIYAPQLTEANPPTVRVSFVVIDPKTGKAVTGATKLDMASFIQKGSPVIPVALKIPLDGVQPGEYKLQFQANVDGGPFSQIRTVPFVVE